MTEEVPGLRLMLSDIDNWVILPPGSQSKKKNQSALVNFVGRTSQSDMPRAVVGSRES